RIPDKEFEQIWEEMALASQSLFRERVREYSPKVVWLLGKEHHRYSEPIIRELGIEPVLSVHPSYYLQLQGSRNKETQKKAEEVMQKLREDWREVQAQLKK